jgi:hypothetical protein
MTIRTFVAAGVAALALGDLHARDPLLAASVLEGGS